MARGAGTVIIKIVGDAAGLNRELNEADRKLGGFGDNVKNNMGKVAGALAGLGVARILGDSTRAAADDEAAQMRLATALRNTVGANDEVVASVERQIEGFMKVSTFSDDDLRPAFQALATETRNVKEASDLMSTAMDLAATKNISVEEAANLLIKAHNGQTRGLAALGVEVKNAEGKAAAFGDVMRDVNQVVGGQAAAALDTSAGKAAQNTIKMGELQEKIGAGLLPVMNGLHSTLGPIVDRLGAMDEGTARIVAGAGLAVVALGPFVTVVGNLSKVVHGLNVAMTAFTAHPLILALSGIAVAAIRVKDIIQDLINLIPKLSTIGPGGVLKEMFRSFKVPGFQFGGTVPGPIGAPRLIMAHGGEEVIPIGGRGPMGGRAAVYNVTNNFYGPQDPVGVARQIQGLLQQERRRSGPLGFE